MPGRAREGSCLRRKVGIGWGEHRAAAASGQEVWVGYQLATEGVLELGNRSMGTGRQQMLEGTYLSAGWRSQVLGDLDGNQD